MSGTDCDIIAYKLEYSSTFRNELNGLELTENNRKAKQGGDYEKQ